MKLIRKKTDHACLGNEYEFMDIYYEFSLDQKFVWVKTRYGIGEKQANWRVYGGDGMRQWDQGTTKNKNKIRIENEINNFLLNNETLESQAIKY